MSTGDDLYLRDVLDIPEDVHAGDFKIELSGGFDQARQRVEEYVVTPQLQNEFRKALGLVKAAVRSGSSDAAYLHGSFGSGKSHFMTVLHAVLNHDPAARAKPELREILAEHDDWLRDRRFLMVPYHLVGAAGLDSAILGGYAATAARLGLAPPPVYRADGMLADARRQREWLADDARFVAWLGDGASPPSSDYDDLEPIDDVPSGSWTSADLDRAFGAAADDPLRDALVSALLTGPMAAYGDAARGARDAFIPLENGLSVMSRHARQHGYDGLILFLDELILWLQAHLSDKDKVNTEVAKLVKLVESGDTDRPVPIVSFISRQRNLSQLVGTDVVGAEVKNLEAQVEYLAGRFTVVTLDDRNLPAIITERVLKPKSDAARAALEDAFASIESSNPAVRDILLDAHGATHADWADFRAVYPLSPALLNVLVALSGALQRERTGLKLLSEMLRLRRDDMRLGQVIPLGDLWDVLSGGIGEAFTDRLRQESEAAVRFHEKVRTYLREKYGTEDDERFRADDRIVKTLVLSALAPSVSALTRLTGGRLAALNLGSIRSRTVPAGTVVVSRLKELIAAGFGEIRADGEQDPVFSLHLSDLDVEPLLDSVGDQDNVGARRIWVKNQLWAAFGVKDSGSFVCEREVVWRGSRRVVEFVFENVRDPSALPAVQFHPSLEGRVRFVIDYPFDTSGNSPVDDYHRIKDLREAGHMADTLVWLPDHFSAQRSTQLGRLLKISYLLERDRLDDYAGHLSADDRVRVRHQLQAQRDNLTSQLAVVLQQVYGIAGGDEGNVAAEVYDGEHVLSLNPGYRRPVVHGGAGFEYNMQALAGDLFATRYPKHPDFDPTGSHKAVTAAELRTVLGWITKAMEDGSRRVVIDRPHLPLVKRIVHPLDLGEVHDGPLTLSTTWKIRIEQQAAQHRAGNDLQVEDIRRWIEDLGWAGLDKLVVNLVIATYALLSDRAWVLNGAVVAQAPELDRIGAGWALRAQPLPTEEEYAVAVDRAGKLFGVTVPAVLFARNVNTLATLVRRKAMQYESDVNAVRRALDRNAAALGLSGQQAPRTRATRHAADLLARLSSVIEATPALRALAAVAYDVSDEVLGSTIVSAPEVLAALEQTDWALLTTVRDLRDGGGDLAEPAQELLDKVARAADADEYTVALAPVLGEARSRAVDLLSKVVRPPKIDPPPPPHPHPHPHPHPPVNEAGGTQRIEPGEGAEAITAAVESIRGEVAGYVADHPATIVEIRWYPIVTGDGD